MITFLTSPKFFTGNDAVNQERALNNWRAVCPEAEIVLFGACEGGETCCRNLNIRRVLDVKVSETGVPYLKSVAEWAEKSARFDLQVYLNADILLPPDFVAYAGSVPPEPFLMVGQRIDLKRDALFNTGQFYEQIARLLDAQQAEVHRPTGMDFFVFRRGMWQDLKPLIVGRGGYDSALVAYCLRKHIPVVDASFAFPVVHQWHDYAHISGGQKQAHYGADARFNFAEHDLRAFGPNCLDADLMMLRSGELVVNSRRSLWRRLEVELYYKRGLKGSPNFNQMWNVVTRGSKYIKNPDWKRADSVM